MASQQNIGIISLMEGYPWGGSEALWYDMAKEALKQNVEVRVSYKYWEALPEQLQTLKRNGASLNLRTPIYLKTPLFKKFIKRFSGQSIPIRKENPFLPFIESNYDVLLINEGAFASLLHFPDLYNYLLKQDVPYVLLVHQNREYGSLPLEWIEKAKAIYAKAKQVLFVSKRNQKMANIQLCTTLNNASVVRNPVNLESTEKIEYPDSQTIKLATIGRLYCQQKGQDILLRALASLENDYNFQLTLYGTGDDEDYLKELTQYLNLDNHVRFAGYQNDVRSIWEEEQMLVLPSHYEGMPIVVVEAMLCGRSCLVTDVAGHKEWIEDEVNGYICESSTVEAMERTLRKALNDKANWKTMGLKARERAFQLYDSHPGKTLLDLVLNHK